MDVIHFMMRHLPGVQGIDWPEADTRSLNVAARQIYEDRHRQMFFAANDVLRDTIVIAASRGKIFFYTQNINGSDEICLTQEGFRYLAETNAFADTLGQAPSQRLRAIVAAVPQTNVDI
jgi:hypothetical protein